MGLETIRSQGSGRSANCCHAFVACVIAAPQAISSTDNIKVAVRVRPLLAGQLDSKNAEPIIGVAEDQRGLQVQCFAAFCLASWPSVPPIPWDSVRTLNHCLSELRGLCSIKSMMLS
jgi:hypothetical protein